jgi:hypothetical protein
MILALTALGLTLAARWKGSFWLLPAVMGHIILWVYVGYALSKVVYVQYRE